MASSLSAVAISRQKIGHSEPGEAPSPLPLSEVMGMGHNRRQTLPPVNLIRGEARPGEEETKPSPTIPLPLSIGGAQVGEEVKPQPTRSTPGVRESSQRGTTPFGHITSHRFGQTASGSGQAVSAFWQRGQVFPGVTSSRE